MNTINKYLFWWDKNGRSLVNWPWNLYSFFLKQEEQVSREQPLQWTRRSKSRPSFIPSQQRATPNNFPWYQGRDFSKKAVKCKVKCLKESCGLHFPHFLVVCLSRPSAFCLTIQEIDAANSRPWFAGHTNLWATLSHWICLLHRSSFQDKPRPETAKKNPYKPDNILSRSWTRSKLVHHPDRFTSETT